MTMFTMPELKGDMYFSCTLPWTDEAQTGNIKHNRCRKFVRVFHTTMQFLISTRDDLSHAYDKAQ